MKKQIYSVEEIGHAIRATRRNSKIRLVDLAQVLGVSKQTTSNVEMGRPTVQVGTVLRHLQGLGIEVHLTVPEAAAKEWQQLINQSKTNK